MEPAGQLPRRDTITAHNKGDVSNERDAAYVINVTAFNANKLQPDKLPPWQSNKRMRYGFEPNRLAESSIQQRTFLNSVACQRLINVVKRLAISTGQLNTSPCVHLPPIDQLVLLGPSVANGDIET